MKSTLKALIIAATLTVACADATEPQQPEEPTNELSETIRVEAPENDHDPSDPAPSDPAPSDPAPSDLTELSHYESTVAELPADLDCSRTIRVNLERSQIRATRLAALAKVVSMGEAYCSGEALVVQMVEVEETSFYQHRETTCGRAAQQEIYVANARIVVSCKTLSRPLPLPLQPRSFEPNSMREQDLDVDTDITELPSLLLEVPVVESCEANSPSCCADQGCCLTAGGGETYCEGRDEAELGLLGAEIRF